MADGEPRGAAGKTAIGDQGTFLTQMDGFKVGSGVEHLLHPRPPFRPLIADDHHITGLDQTTQNGLTGRLLRGEDPGRAGKLKDGRINPGGLDDTALGRNVTVEDGQAPIEAVTVSHVADTAGDPVKIRFGIHGRLGAHHQIAAAGGRGAQIESSGRFAGTTACNIPVLQRCGKCWRGRSCAVHGARDTGPSMACGRSCAVLGTRDTGPSMACGRSCAVLGARDTGPSMACVHPVDRGVNQSGPGQFTENPHDAAGPVHILHMIMG